MCSPGGPSEETRLYEEPRTRWCDCTGRLREGVRIFCRDRFQQGQDAARVSGSVGYPRGSRLWGVDREHLESHHLDRDPGKTAGLEQQRDLLVLKGVAGQIVHVNILRARGRPEDPGAICHAPGFQLGQSITTAPASIRSNSTARGPIFCPGSWGSRPRLIQVCVLGFRNRMSPPGRARVL